MKHLNKLLNVTILLCFCKVFYQRKKKKKKNSATFFTYYQMKKCLDGNDCLNTDKH